MDKITILPITPGKHPSFLTLFTVLVADAISKLTGAKLVGLLNTTAINRSESEMQQKYEKYLFQLQALDVNEARSFMSDSDELYRQYIEVAVDKLLKAGKLRFAEWKISWCDCGIVEIPSMLVDILTREQRAKLLVICNRDGVCCSKCGQPLHCSKEECLELWLEPTKEVKVFPLCYQKEAKSALGRLGGQPLLISRKHRPGQQIEVAGRTVVLDNDFRWLCFLGYLIGREEHICLVAGSDSLNQAVRALCLSSFTGLSNLPALMIHPFLEVRNDRLDLSNFTIESYLNYCGSSAVARTFLMLGAQWSKSSTVIDSREFHLVKKSVFPRTMSTGGRSVLPLTEVPKILNRELILRMLKKLRSARPLDEQEESLMRLIFAPSPVV